MSAGLNQQLAGCRQVAMVILGAALFLTILLALGYGVMYKINEGEFPPPDLGAPAGQGGANPGGLASPEPTVPVISAREFTSGSSALTVSGAFALDPTVRFETGGDSDGQRAHIEYWVGDEALPDPSITLVMGAAGGEPNHIEVYRGEWSAIDTGDGCTWRVTVTATTVSGHVSCPAIPAENLYDGSTGTVSVELDFVANSP